MALMAEYAVTPDVFDVTSYSSEEVCGLHLATLRRPFLDESIVRDLRGGEWSRVFLGEQNQWHRITKELLKKLDRDGRLIRFDAVLPTAPGGSVDWCREAVAGHVRRELAGIITTRAVAEQFRANEPVAAIDRLSGAPWWQLRSQSLRLPRTMSAYKGALRLLLQHANSLMFIDPHLDLDRRQYSEFVQLLETVGARRPVPRIELHRVCYRGSGRERVILKAPEIEASFRSALTQTLDRCGLGVDVFVWDDFHYRFVISNLAGILMDNGFDTSAAVSASTIWSRLGRDVSEDVQREFDPPSNRHTLVHRFGVP